MLSTDSVSMLECFQRTLPSSAIPKLKEVARKCKFFVIFELGDALAANDLCTKMVAFSVPEAHTWVQRCESHQCNLVSSRPMDNHGLCTAMYCLARLLRQKQVHQRLCEAMEKMADKEVQGQVWFGRQPDARSQYLFRALVELCILPILKWGDEAAEHDVLAEQAPHVPPEPEDEFMHVVQAFWPEHEPCSQTSPLAHVRPHEPQFCSS